MSLQIEILSGATLNYEMKNNYLKFNLGLIVKGVMVMKQVEFVRDNKGFVEGCFYEYNGVESAAIKTSAVFTFNNDYFKVMSTKRESDDLLIKGYEEVYSSVTGKFISAEVLENNILDTSQLAAWANTVSTLCGPTQWPTFHLHWGGAQI